MHKIAHAAAILVLSMIFCTFKASAQVSYVRIPVTTRFCNMTTATTQNPAGSNTIIQCDMFDTPSKALVQVSAIDVNWVAQTNVRTLAKFARVCVSDPTAWTPASICGANVFGADFALNGTIALTGSALSVLNDPAHFGWNAWVEYVGAYNFTYGYETSKATSILWI